MIAFLAWLYVKVIAVKDWFSAWYSYAVFVLTYVVGWIAAAIDSAYDKAKAYIDEKVDAFFDDAGALVAALGLVLIGIINAVLATVIALGRAVIVARDLAIAALLVVVRALIKVAEAALIVLIDAAIALAKGLISALSLTIWTALRPLLLWISFLVTLKNLFTTTNLARMVEFLKNGYLFLLAFTRDPVGVIAAYIKLFFRTMFEFTMAYALGTVEATLPAWPNFGVGGGFLPPPDNGGPPPGASGLSPPLSSIYVSGYTFGGDHKGIDLGLTSGQSVYAMHAGKVVTAFPGSTGYGYVIVIKGDEWWTRYAHLLKFHVSVGSNVKAGQTIAGGDTTGNSTGNHLHLEIKHNGKFIDPLTVL